MTQRVFVDANVLFSKTLLDWIFHLRVANEGMFQLHTTEDVLAEVLTNMRKKCPTAPGHLTRHRLELMRAAIDEIIQDYPSGLDFTGKDEGDYHVHAAATASGADILLSANSADDITCTPDAESYEVMHPDEFFLLVTDAAPRCLKPIIVEQVRYWSKQESPHMQLDEALVKAGCPEFGKRARTVLRQIGRSGLR